MQVRYVENPPHAPTMTLGKVYQVLVEDGPYFRIRSDDGMPTCVHRGRFEVVDKTPPPTRCEFSPGDEVKRVGGALGGMMPGDVDVVVHAGKHEVQLRRFGQGHSARDLAVYNSAAVVADRAGTGRKDDGGKLDMNLLDDMPRAIKAVVEVMQWAIEKKTPVPYVRGSWLGVEPDRYRAAIKRHERSAAEQATPEAPARLQRDSETALLHLAHTACSALMALENVLREQEGHKS